MSKVSFVVVTFLGLLTLNFQCMGTGVDAIEIGEVKCTQTVKWTEAFYKAHEDCQKKVESASNKGDDDEDPKPYPRNASLEEFDYDDKCNKHCVYKAVGILTKDDQLPDKTETIKIFTKGKMLSDESFSKIITTWNDCLEKTGKIAVTKKLENCKTVALHDFCFFKKIYYDLSALEVKC